MIWSVSEHCFFCGHVIGEDGCGSCGTVRRARSERRIHAPCPRCGREARLVPFGIGEAALQACSRCKGMFVSAPDWDTLLDVFTTEPLPDVVVPDAEGASVHGPYRSPPSSGAPQLALSLPVRCPTCDDEMERLVFAGISRVVIDVCPEHGVWLDAGELEGIMESFHPRPFTEPISRAPSDRELRRAMPQTLAEAAAEPIEPAAVPAPWTSVAPDAVPTAPVPTPHDERQAHVPWTTQLARALGRLMRMIR